MSAINDFRDGWEGGGGGGGGGGSGKSKQKNPIWRRTFSFINDKRERI
jgi:hypothetical protein